MFSVLSKTAPLVSEFGGAFFRLLGNTAKTGTAIGVVAGAALAPAAALNACENSSPNESPNEVAVKASTAAVKTMLTTTAIGFYVGTAPVSVPVKCLIDHYHQNKMNPT